jgi:hypothetical protein
MSFETIRRIQADYFELRETHFDRGHQRFLHTFLSPSNEAMRIARGAS